MEAIALGIVYRTVKRLGFSRDAAVTIKAAEIAVLAVRDGRSIEVAVELAESELARALQPSAA